MSVEKTLILVKPDGVQRGLTGEIINRLEKRGLQIVAAKLIRPTRAIAEEHYQEHVGKPFYEGLIEFITSGPVLAMVIQGERAINISRQTIGSTDPAEAAPGTIRGDLGLTVGRNLVHGSDSAKRGAEEINIWFDQYEIIKFDQTIHPWVIES